MVKPALVSKSKLPKDRMSLLFGKIQASKLNGEVKKFRSKLRMKLSKMDLLITKMFFKL